MMRGSTLIPRPSPIIVGGKLYEPKLICHICGKTGIWRPAYYGWNKVLGEVLCNNCAHPTFHLPIIEDKECGK